MLLDEVRIFDRRLQCGVELGQHVSRCALGGIQAVPYGHVKALQARGVQRCQILQSRRLQLFQRGHAVSLDLFRFDLRRSIGGLVAHQIDGAAHQVGDGRCCALVRHGGHLHIQRALEHQAAQVARRTQARVANVDLLFFLVDPGAQFAEVIGFQGGAANDGHGHIVDDAQELKVVEHVERQLAVQRRHGGHADVIEQQGVAVGWGTRHLGGANGAACAGNVFNHYGSAAQRLAHGFCQIAGDAVGGAACREGHHDRDVFTAGEILCHCAERDSGSSQGNGSNTEGWGHGESPDACRSL